MKSPTDDFHSGRLCCDSFFGGRRFGCLLSILPFVGDIGSGPVSAVIECDIIQQFLFIFMGWRGGLVSTMPVSTGTEYRALVCRVPIVVLW